MRVYGVGVDFGRHDTKAVCKDKWITFPSIVSPYVDVRYDDQEVNGSVAVTVRRKRKDTLAVHALVGYAAAQQSREATIDLTPQREWQDVIALVAEAFWLLGVEQNDQIHLCVGAPVEYYRKARGLYMDWLEGRWEINHLRVDVVAVHVMPEPVGTLMSYSFNTDGTIRDPEIRKQNVAILDIGGYTTDGVVYESVGGKPSRLADRFSFGDPFGVSRVVDYVHEYLVSEHERDIERYRLHDPIRHGRISFDGQYVELGTVIALAVQQQSRYLSRLLENHWKSVFGLQRLIVTGGGAGYYFPVVQQWRSIAELASETCFSNVLGFAGVAERKARTDA